MRFANVYALYKSTYTLLYFTLHSRQSRPYQRQSRRAVNFVAATGDGVVSVNFVASVHAA